MTITKQDIPIAALLRWACPACGGTGIYQQDRKGRERKLAQGQTPDPHYQPAPAPCKFCNGTKLHPIAYAALETVGALPGAKP